MWTVSVWDDKKVQETVWWLHNNVNVLNATSVSPSTLPLSDPRPLSWKQRMGMNPAEN